MAGQKQTKAGSPVPKMSKGKKGPVVPGEKNRGQGKKNTGQAKRTKGA